MATYRHTFRWRPLGGVTITHAQLQRLLLPEDCWLDGMGLQPDGSFRSLCLSWPGRFGEEFRTFAEALVLEWWEQVKDRRAPAAPFPRRQVQALLLRALHELEGEFSDLIRQRVACVMGDPGAKPPRSSGETLALRQGKPRPRSRPPAPPLRSEPTARPRPTTTAQTRSDERTRIRAAVLAVLADGRGRGRGDLLQASRLFESDVPALHAVLRALVAENLIEMIGQRGGTRYVARRPTDGG